MRSHQIINAIKAICVSFIILVNCFQPAMADPAGNSVAASAPKAKEVRFLTLADIHFDPFVACHQRVPCPLIQKLQKASVSEWPQILRAYDNTQAQYKEDTSYPLLASALEAAKAAAIKQNVQFVVVLGDFLGHEYRECYKLYAQDKSRAGFQSFVRKSLSFLTNEINQAFPNINVYMVVGNNDSYYGDYAVVPRSQFFVETAQTWASVIRDKTSRAAMLREFPEAGYYAITLPDQPSLRLIVLNSVLFSYKSYAKHADEAANQELIWLQQQLTAARDQHQQVLIAMHIPAGIDIYATLKFRLFRLIELWKRPYTVRFEAMLREFSPEVIGILAGHLHSDWFQIMTLSNANAIPITGTPSISPIFGNNPGFKIYTYMPAKRRLENFDTYYYPFKKQSSWTKEYNFSQVYQPKCETCSLVAGMNDLKANNELVNAYKRFYFVSSTISPLLSSWQPYYWCGIHEVTAAGYLSCVG